jgi:hypothetical protein
LRPTGPQSDKPITKIRQFGEKTRQIADIEIKVGLWKSTRFGVSAKSSTGITKSVGRDNAPEGMTGVPALG